MNRKQKVTFILLLALIAIFLLVILRALGILSFDLHWAFLSPKGVIAYQERKLFIIALSIMLVVAIPMLATLFFFVHKYRADQNRPAEYRPDWGFNPWLQAIWWGIPITVITIIGVINWQSTHALDPYKAIASDKPPITIQVISLQWKWLFIYPQQNIATVNFLEFPENTPLKFELTADSPMNSFWVPQLGSQIYTMPGMETHLNLMANQLGDFKGSSAEISGAGFSDMNFVARSVSQTDYEAWLASAKQTDKVLNLAEYSKLSEPDTVLAPIIYSSAQNDLFYSVIEKYMGPENSGGHHH